MPRRSLRCRNATHNARSSALACASETVSGENLWPTRHSNCQQLSISHFGQRAAAIRAHKFNSPLLHVAVCGSPGRTPRLRFHQLRQNRPYLRHRDTMIRLDLLKNVGRHVPTRTTYVLFRLFPDRHSAISCRGTVDEHTGATFAYPPVSRAERRLGRPESLAPDLSKCSRSHFLLH